MATRSGASGGGSSSRGRGTAGRADKSLEAFRDALERSVTISRDRLQEVVDDAVKRGRMTRSDANELVERLVARGRRQRDELLRRLERLIEQARREVEQRVAAGQRQVGRAASRAARVTRDVADRPLAQADRLRRRARVSGGMPITAYDQLTVAQIRSRLGELSPGDLRKVRDRERRGKARKSILSDIDRRLKRG